MALLAFTPGADDGRCATTGAEAGAGTGLGRSARHGRAGRCQGRVLAACGLALLPWLGYLAGTLPPAEAAAWVALDTLEAAALLTAGHLLADACLDLAAAAPGPELAAAVAMAVAAELPLAALCARLAVRPPRGPVGGR